MDYSYVNDHNLRLHQAGPVLTNRTDVLPQYLVKSRSHEIWIMTGTVVR